MQKQLHPNLLLTRRAFVTACVHSVSTLALAHLPAWAVAERPTSNVLALPGDMDSIDLQSAWQQLRQAPEQASQFVLRHGLAPLFGRPPAASQHIASSTHPDYRT